MKKDNVAPCKSVDIFFILDIPVGVLKDIVPCIIRNVCVVLCESVNVGSLSDQPYIIQNVHYSKSVSQYCSDSSLKVILNDIYVVIHSYVD